MSDPEPSNRKLPQLKLKPWQLGAIVGEAILLCSTSGVLLWFVVFGVGNSVKPATVAQFPTAAATSTPAVSLTPSITPLPTLTLTPTPKPANTRVVSREMANQATINKIKQQVSLSRKMEPFATVPAKFLTSDKSLAYIRQRYAGQRDAAQKELMVYRALGLVQAGQVDPEAVIKAVAAQVAGFYDPKEKQLYVISDLENLSAKERATLAHEYTHALQDQRFDLAKYQGKIHTTDERLAMLALPEGDATVVMALYLYNNTTKAEWAHLASRAQLVDSPMITATNFSTRVLSILYFPYVQGAQYVTRLFLASKGWTQVNRAYENPPQTTTQVMHPERYTVPRKPVDVPGVDLAPLLSQEWGPVIITDTLGEFITIVHMDEFMHNMAAAAQAADGWAGDSFTLWQNPAGKQVFAWQFAWNTQRDTNEFFETYSRLFYARIGADIQIERSDKNVNWYSGNAGSGFVYRAGTRTLVVWGPDKAAVEPIQAALTAAK